MKAFQIQENFGLENLTLTELPDPVPGPGEVLLKMRAVSLNYRDLMTVAGTYNPRQPLPLTPCSDGVGEVVEVGEGVASLKPGDRVATLFSQGWMAGGPTAEALRSTLGGPVQGTLSERMVLPEEGVIRVPDHLTDAEAATLPCAALTAWSALAEQGRVAAGDTVLVLGTGGVSIFALQFAQLLGARAIITSSNNDKLVKARGLGAWQEINYMDDPDWGKTARALTGGRGVDHVVEVGGAGTLEQSLRAVRVGGRISVIGVLSGVMTTVNVVPILMQHVSMQGILVGSREGFERMNRAVAHHELRPVVDRVFPFGESLAAFEYMSSAAHFGKVCIAFEP
jgi:NADPH:quinone reductase-like Zn-dependent oxidoreductase